MAVKIRLARFGRNKVPFYHIVATDSRNRRDSKFLEKLGTYNPLLNDDNAISILDFLCLHYKTSIIFNSQRYRLTIMHIPYYETLIPYCEIMYTRFYLYVSNLAL